MSGSLYYRDINGPRNVTNLTRDDMLETCLLFMAAMAVCVAFQWFLAISPLLTLVLCGEGISN